MKFPMALLFKTFQDRKSQPREHIIGRRGVQLFLPKDFSKFCQKLSIDRIRFFCFVTVSVEFGYNLSFCLLSHFELLSFVSILEFLTFVPV